MPKDLRIQRHPRLVFQRGREISFAFLGERIKAFDGESLGVAAYAAGHRIFSRSLKFHRPRGLFCMRGLCPNCAMRVDGLPGVAVCAERARDGAHVQGQHGWPSIEFDLLSLIDKLDFLFPVGFQYRRFIRPRALWPLYSRIIRKMAGIGRAPDESAIASLPSATSEPLEPEMAVVGGGPAGISAACTASQNGVRVLLLDENPEFGGLLRWQSAILDAPEVFAGMRGFRAGRELEFRLRNEANVDAHAGTAVIADYEDGLLIATSCSKLFQIRPRKVIFATGRYEEPRIFENNDLPGVFLSTGLQILMHRYGVRPGEKSCVVGSGPRAEQLAQELVDSGVQVACIVSTEQGQTPNKRFRFVDGTSAQVFTNVSLIRARGRSRVTGCTIHAGVETRGIECDTICLVGPTRPAHELLLQRGLQVAFDDQAAGFTVDEEMMVADDAYAVGSLTRSGKSLSRILLEGEIAGLSCVVRLGRGNRRTERQLRDAQTRLRIMEAN